MSIFLLIANSRIFASFFSARIDLLRFIFIVRKKNIKHLNIYNQVIFTFYFFYRVLRPQ